VLSCPLDMPSTCCCRKSHQNPYYMVFSCFEHSNGPFQPCCACANCCCCCASLTGLPHLIPHHAGPFAFFQTVTATDFGQSNMLVWSYLAPSCCKAPDVTCTCCACCSCHAPALLLCHSVAAALPPILTLYWS
jgi:hypothetical protein